MTPAKFLFTAILLAGLLLLAACSHLFSPETSLPSRHPEELPQQRAVCTDCHDPQRTVAFKSYGAFDHTPGFVRDHRFAAGQNEKVCGMCHATSFCNDCHANQLEVKPSVKLGDRPDRELPHRGDYLTRHKIDGKIDPTGCYRCHGRANNEKCVQCHR